MHTSFSPRQRGEQTPLFAFLPNIVQLWIRELFIPIGIGLITILTDAPWCPLRHIIGIPCPTCGMTRSYRSLLRAKWEQAFLYHPLFWIVPILVGLILLRHTNQRIRQLVTNTFFWVGIAGIVLLVWGIRLFLFFPHTVPMDFNSQALVPQTIQKLSLSLNTHNSSL